MANPFIQFMCLGSACFMGAPPVAIATLVEMFLQLVDFHGSTMNFGPK